eukprot:2639623-Prymnesium_polylepis.1
MHPVIHKVDVFRSRRLVLTAQAMHIGTPTGRVDASDRGAGVLLRCLAARRAAVHGQSIVQTV